MTDDDEVGSDLFGDACDLLSGGSHAEPRRRGEADGLESLHALFGSSLIGCDLIVDRDHDAALQRRAEGRLDNSQQEHFGAAKLRELRALPQRQPPLDGTVIGKKNFLVQDSPPSFAALTSNRCLARIFRPTSAYYRRGKLSWKDCPRNPCRLRAATSISPSPRHLSPLQSAWPVADLEPELLTTAVLPDMSIGCVAAILAGTSG